MLQRYVHKRDMKSDSDHSNAIASAWKAEFKFCIGCADNRTGMENGLGPSGLGRTSKIAHSFNIIFPISRCRAVPIFNSLCQLLICTDCINHAA